MKKILLSAALAFGLSLTIPAQVQETRFDVKTPPTTNPVTLGISPDGDKIFFVADRDGKYELWVHWLSSGIARPLPGTADSSLPAACWSPDSRSIAFFGLDNFRRIDLESENVRPLVSFLAGACCDPALGSQRSSAPPQIGGGGVVGTGCTWNRDGTILFSSRRRAIFRIPDQGGTPAPVTPPDPLYYHAPYFLPDGQHFLFGAQGRVYVGEIGGAAPRLLPIFGTSPIYAPSGHVLFVREGTLYARAFDPSTQTLLSGPFPVAEQVPISIPRPAAASISAAGHLVYRTGPGGNLRQFKWFDRAGKELGTVGELFDMGAAAPELSPDGKTVALSSAPGDIWLMDVSNGKLTSFVSGPANDGWPVWSPDGTIIYFTSNQTGRFEMYEKPASGNESAKLVMKSDASGSARQVSPDGRFLLFTVGGDISAIQLDGNPRGELPRGQTPSTDEAPQFAPDGKWIAYQEVDENDHADIYLRQFPSGRRVRVSTGGGVHPRWRADGKELFYIANGRLMAAPIELSPNGQEAKVETPVSLFTPPLANSLASGFMQQYAVSRDGQRFLVATIPNLDFPIHVIRDWKPQR